MEKKAQFYLMAAIIIVGIVIVLATITNYIVTREEPVRIYDLSDEFKEEGARVVDYGIYSNDPDAINLLMDKFSTYSEEKDRGSELVFAFGNSTNFTMVTYASIKTGSIKLIVPGTTLQIDPPAKKARDVTSMEHNSDAVNVSLFGQDYEFKLHEGENFFFVISKNATETDEVYIVKKED